MTKPKQITNLLKLKKLNTLAPQRLGIQKLLCLQTQALVLHTHRHNFKKLHTISNLTEFFA